MPDCDGDGVLALRGWGLAFGDRVVIPAVDLVVPPVGCTVLFGQEGIGKSALLRTLAGRGPTSPSLRCWGVARYLGEPWSPTHRPLLVQPSVQQLSVSVQDGLVVEMAGRDRLTRTAQLERVVQVLQQHGLSHLQAHLRTKLVDLPLLDQRRLMVLRGVLAEPALLCLDEPLQGLDAAGAQALIGLLQRVAHGRAVLVGLSAADQAAALGGCQILLGAAAPEPPAQAPAVQADSPAPSTVPEPPVMPPVVQAPAGLGAVVTRVQAQAASRRASAGPSGFHWLLPGQLAGTPWPGVVHDARYDLDVLRHVGISCLISLTETPFDPGLAGQYGMRCVASPMPDMAPPSLEQAIDLCQTIDQALSQGEAVAVHCYAGLGRTGTVLVCYALWRARGALSGAQALTQARRIHPGWVQSQAQVAFLDAFGGHLARGEVAFPATVAG